MLNFTNKRFSAQLSLYLGFFIFVFIVTLALTDTIQSWAASLELAGKADWGRYGSIYFHCSETHTGNLLDENKNLQGAGLFLPPAEEAFHFTGLPCEIVYGVKIEERSGVISGSAWNNSLGRVYFSRSDNDDPPPNNNFYGSCPNADVDSCSFNSECIACYDFTTGKIHGWAFIKYEREERTYYDWISLDSEKLSVYLPLIEDQQEPGYDLDLGDLGGKAEVQKSENSYDYPSIIDFHCLTKPYPNAPPSPYCDDFKVHVKDLIIANLSAPNWGQDSACYAGALRATLRWNSFGAKQLGYEIIVGTADDFEASQNNPICHVNPAAEHPETGEEVLIENGDKNHYIITESSTSDCQGGLDYDTKYYWWIRAYYEVKTANLDEQGQIVTMTTSTPWIQYDSNTEHDTDKNLDKNPKTFQTFKHEMPKPIFSYEELEFDFSEDSPELGTSSLSLTNTTTIFTSASKYYTTSRPRIPSNCTDNACSYLWETDNSEDILHDEDGNDSNTSNPIYIIFDWAGLNHVKLTVEDNDGYSCSGKLDVYLDWDLPVWKEVKPD